jgi:hypothetical protein
MCPILLLLKLILKLEKSKNQEVPLADGIIK